jgi:hypothetical protein
MTEVGEQNQDDVSPLPLSYPSTLFSQATIDVNECDDSDRVCTPLLSFFFLRQLSSVVFARFCLLTGASGCTATVNAWAILYYLSTHGPTVAP